MYHSPVDPKEESFQVCCYGPNTEGMGMIDVIPGWIRNDMNHKPQDLLGESRILTDELVRALGNIDRRWAQFPCLRQRAVGLFQLVPTMGKCLPSFHWFSGAPPVPGAARISQELVRWLYVKQAKVGTPQCPLCRACSSSCCLCQLCSFLLVCPIPQSLPSIFQYPLIFL